MASPCFPRPPARSASGPRAPWGSRAPQGALRAPRGGTKWPFGAPGGTQGPLRGLWGDLGLSTRGLAFVTCLDLSKLLGRSRAPSGDLEGFRVILKRRNRLGAETLISQKRMAWRLLHSRGEFLKRIIVLGLGFKFKREPFKQKAWSFQGPFPRGNDCFWGSEAQKVFLLKTTSGSLHSAISSRK